MPSLKSHFQVPSVMVTRVVLLVALVAAQQANAQPEAATAAAPDKFVPVLTESQCKAKGGSWIGGLTYRSCQFPFADANKPCSSSTQCLSKACVATLIVEPTEKPGNTIGTCQPFAGTFGCVTRVENGVRMPTVCVD
jgi:hypothetical protein